MHQYKVVGRNPNPNDPLYLETPNQKVKEMRPWQRAAFDLLKDEDFASVQQHSC